MRAFCGSGRAVIALRALRHCGAAVVGLVLLAACATPTAPPGLAPVVAAWPARSAPHAAPGTLGPGDQVEVFVWGYEDLTRRATVSFTGTLPYPLLGDVPVAGRTVAEVEAELRAGVQRYIRDAVVRVSVTGMRPQRLFVLGEVRTPGAVTMASPAGTLAEALAGAGGLTQDANERELLILREEAGKVLVMPVDYARMVRGQAAAPAVAATDPAALLPGLRDGDTVYVPPSGLTSIARSARRVVDVITPVLAAQQVLLNLQSSTLVWKDFIRALHGEDNPDRVQNIIITPPR